MPIDLRQAMFRSIEASHSIARNMSNQGLCDALTRILKADELNHLESAVVSEIVGRLCPDDDEEIEDTADDYLDDESARQLVLDHVTAAETVAVDFVDSCDGCPFSYWRVVSFDDEGGPITMPKPFLCCHPNSGSDGRKVTKDDDPYNRRPDWCPLDTSLAVVLPVARATKTLDVEARRAEKQASRDADAKALADGTKTRAQLREENGFISGANAKINWESSKP